MVVNEKKTEIMAVSSALGYEARTHIETGNQGAILQSKKSFKILGFTLDSDGGIRTHLNILTQKFRRRVWLLRVAKRAGMSQDKLLATYLTHVRPLAECNSVVLQPLMTAEQSESLERQQSLALAIIYGPGLSAARMREMANIPRLETRREETCKKFVRKALDSNRFKHWFPTRPEPRYQRRESQNYKKYVEYYARTDRRRSTPKFYLRRLANGLQ